MDWRQYNNKSYCRNPNKHLFPQKPDASQKWRFGRLCSFANGMIFRFHSFSGQHVVSPFFWQLRKWLSVDSVMHRNRLNGRVHKKTTIWTVIKIPWDINEDPNNGVISILSLENWVITGWYFIPWTNQPKFLDQCSQQKQQWRPQRWWKRSTHLPPAARPPCWTGNFDSQTLIWMEPETSDTTWRMGPHLEYVWLVSGVISHLLLRRLARSWADLLFYEPRFLVY